VRVWRICAGRYAAETLSGRGGLLTPGRWHSGGRPVVYTSSSLALAALEVLVHVDKDLVPAGLAQVAVDIPDDLDVLTVDVESLPRGWQRHPAPSALQKRGDRWLAEAPTPVLQVPSAVIPTESNFLLNPRHPDFPSIAVASTDPFVYDPRLVP
jgi:RES domain-containing protein